MEKEVKHFDWEDTAPCEYEPPRPEEEIADDWFSDKPKDNYSSRHKSTPDHEKGAEEIVTMHEKMYRMATAKYNPFAIGGSESIQDFQGGSENVHDKGSSKGSRYSLS